MSRDYLVLRCTDDLHNTNFAQIQENAFWNNSEAKELKRHKIHAYPAKFPAFITTKALDFAEQEGLKVRRVADIFCGCGTVAFEAKRNNIDFWGCDINPVATLIAKAKSLSYNVPRLNQYVKLILEKYESADADVNFHPVSLGRLMYWYSMPQFLDVSTLFRTQS